MPVHEVSPGRWRFGETGKIYRSKAAAEAQARAIYSTGWREDAARAKARRIAARPLRASKRAETRYVADLLRVMARTHEGVMRVVHAEYLPPEESRRDAASSVGLGAGLKHKLFAWQKPQVQRAFDFMADEVSKKQAKTLTGIVPRLVPGLDAVIDEARQRNVDLITNATSDFLDQIREVLEENEGETATTIAALLEERVGVSQSRAMLIARDQTLKLNSNIAQSRMRAAGVERYTWSGSLDERERPMHRALEGQVFSFDSPPVTNDDGDTNNPGEDYQCRCVGIPYIEELEDEPDEDLGGALEGAIAPLGEDEGDEL